MINIKKYLNYDTNVTKLLNANTESIEASKSNEALECHPQLTNTLTRRLTVDGCGKLLKGVVDMLEYPVTLKVLKFVGNFKQVAASSNRNQVC